MTTTPEDAALTTPDDARPPILDFPDAEPGAPDARPLPDRGPPAPVGCEGGEWLFQANGQQRRVLVQRPPDLAEGAPVFVLLHGNGDSAGNFCATTPLCRHGTEIGALVLAPDGRRRPIQGYNLSWDAYDPSEGNEDFALLQQMLDASADRCGSGDVYVWGHSQGGFFGYMAAMVGGPRIAGAAISAAASPLGNNNPPWRPASRFPVHLLIGDRDPGLGAAQETASWLERNGHPVELQVLPGVGHAGYPGDDPASIWMFLRR